ncbi:beta strand repeat-containing protein [Burkholderia multivorans]|uniref:beta strand repeat-containing protein n=1 Tax=Burkholderia multivorans TaxID=87883 RepID=UPI001F1A861B|nr:YadA-like family protein [Burkholderia multivorans]
MKVNDGSGEAAGDAVATGAGSIAVGPATSAGNYATAIGQKTTAVDWSTAVGYQASASGKQSTAVGFGAHTNGNAEAVAVGSGAFGDGTGAVAVGRQTRAAQDGIATGNKAISNATDSIAVGRNATAGTKSADGTTVGTGAIAIGADSNATYLGNVAIGRGAAATQTSAVALGMDSVADRANTLSVGRSEVKDANGKVTRSAINRQVVNVAAGTHATDATNVGQLSATLNALGGGAGVNADGTIKAPSYDLANGGKQTTVGGALSALDTATSKNATDIANVKGDVTNISNSVTNATRFVNAKGTSTDKTPVATGTWDVAIGANAVADSRHAPGTNPRNYSMAIGNGAAANGGGAVALGGGAVVGSDATTSKAINGTAIGAGSSVTQANAVALGNGAVADRANTVSVGTSGTQRQIVNVKAGTAGKDATNVDQLTAAVNALGGDAKLDATTGALSALDTATSKNTTDIANVKGDVTNVTNNIANGTVGLVQQDLTSKSITVAKDKDGASVSIAGAAGNRTLTGVNAGTLSAMSKDAVNGAQLFATNQNVAKNTSDIGGLTTQVTNISNSVTNATRFVNAKGTSTDKTPVATGTWDVAIGANAVADSRHAPGTNPRNYSMAIGNGAAANGGGAVAVGGGAVVGSDATANKQINGTAVGAGSSVTQANAVALGNGAVADRANTVSVGTSSAQRQIVNVKAGTAGKDATNVDQLTAAVNALGGDAKLDATTGAVTGPTYDLANGGKQATVGGALSALDTATSKNTTDIANVKGDVTNVTNNIANGTVGLVQQDPTSKNITVAKDKDGTSVSIAGAAGDRTLTGVKAGTANTDAVNVAQLNDAVKAASGAGSRYVKVNDWTGGIAGDTVANGTGSIAIGPATSTSGRIATAIGQNAGAGEGSAAIGYQASASGARSVAMGFGAHTNSNDNAVAVGSNASGEGTGAVAVGRFAKAAQDGIAAGNTAVAVANDSIAVGRNARAGSGTVGGGSIAIGADSSTWYQGNVAIGRGAAVRQTSAVALGMDSVADRAKTVSVGRAEVKNDKGEVTTSAINRQVVNVAAGTQATDATNVEQLTAAVNALGGDAKLDAATGAVTGPTYDLANGGKQTTVGGALNALDTATSKNATDIENVKGDVTNVTNNITNGTLGLVQQDPKSKNITVAKDKDGTNVSLTGTAGDRTLTGLGAGLTDNSAVNLAQLKSAGFDFDAKGNVTNAAVTYTPGTIASGSPQIVLNPGEGDSKYYVDGDRSKGKLPKGTIISNVADGKQNTDAANVGQVFDIVNSAVAGGANGAPAIDLRSMPRPASMALGAPAPTGSGVDTTGLVNAYKTAGYYSQATGLGNSVGSTPPSDMAHAVGQGSIAYGSNANAAADKSSALGVQAYTSAADSVALGAGSVANQANTVSVGSDGTGSYTAIDANGKPYTIQNAANTRRVVNMAAGQSDTDAVNVSQLKGVTDALGGGAGVNPDGTVKAPSYDLANGGKQTTVGGALSALDTATTKNTTDIAGVKGDVTNITNNIANGTVGLVQQDPTSKQITVAKDKDGTSVSIAGTAGNRTLTGINAGALSATSTDAVNGAQLFATNQNVAKNTSDIGGLTTQVTNIGNSVTNATRFVNAKGSSTDKAAVATGTRDIAIGAGAVADSTNASGHSPQNYSVAIGNGATANGGGAVAFGGGAVVGSGATVGDQINGTAVGAGTSVTQANAVALGYGSVADRANTVSVGASGAERQIANVKAGTADTDATTVSQLKGVASAIGGGAGVNADGTIKAPSFDLANGGKQTTVGGALSALDTATSKNTADIAKNAGDIGTLTNTVNNINANIGDIGNMVSYDDAAHDKLTLGGLKDDGKGGKVPATTAVTVSNVAAGKAGNDATNVDQLSAAVNALGGGAKLDATTGAVTGPTYDLANGGKQTTVGGALSALDTATTKNTTDIAGVKGDVTNITNNIANGTVGLVQQDPTSKQITVAKDKDGTSVSIAGTAGNRTLTGINAGALSAASTDAVNGAQLFATNQNVAKNTSDIGGLTTQVTNISNSVTNATRFVNAKGSSTDKAAVATGTRDVAIGAGAVADSMHASGYSPQNYSVAIGNGATANGGGALAFGGGAVVGSGATVGAQINGTAVGAGTSVTQANAVALGYGSVADRANTVSVGASGAERQIANVKAGSADTDATTVSQLKGVASAIGGGAGVNADGTIKAPSFDLANGGKQTTVGGALNALDTATSKNATDLANMKGDVTNVTNNITNGTIGLVQQDPTSKDITVAKDKDGTNVSLTGTTGDRTLTGLGAGLVDNSAVNLAQLKSAGFDFDAKGNVTNSAVTYRAGTIASGSPHIVLSAGQGDSPYFVDGDRAKGKLPKGTIISNVANGKQDTDAANVGQVYDIMNQVDQSSDLANAIQTRAMPGPVSVSKPSWWPANGSTGQTINLRAGTDSSGVDVTGLTNSYKTAGYYSQATGLGNSVGSTPPSDMARAAGQGSVAYGSNAYASADKSAAVGVQAYTSAADSVALGAGSVANQANTVSVGSDGTGAYTAVDGNGQTYTIHNGANTRRVVNMAAGIDDTDAVNVSQLKGVTSALGGGAAVNADGTIKAPTFSVQGGTQTTVADALGSLDTATTKNANDIAKATGDIANVTNTINNITNGAAGLVQQDPSSKEITVAKDKDGKSVSIAGTAGERTLTGLSDGVLSATSTDAVTGSQLYATNEAVQKNTGDIGSLSQKVNNINANIGNVGNMVAYDNDQHDSLTLGGLKSDGNGGLVPATKPVKVSNVAAGTSASDAATVGQLSPLVDALGGGAKLDSATGVVTGPTYTVQGTTQTTVGGAVTALDSATTKNASDIVNVKNDVTTIANNITNGKTGLVQQDDATKSITVAKALGGDKVDFTGTDGTRELTGVSAGKVDSSAATVGQLRPVVDALGGGAAINPDGSIVAPTYSIQGKTEHTVGDAFKSVDDNLASLKTQIGNGGIGIVTQDATTGIINIGGSLGGDRVNIAGTGGDRVLAGVAPGAVSATSNEAVNGSQAYNNASSVASALGGGSTVNPDGTITAPSFNVGGTTVHSVGDAVNNLDGRVTQNTNAISGMQSKIDNVTGQVANAVQYDSAAHDKVTLGDATKGDGVKVSNVANGELSATSRDAVNGSQLFATNSRLDSLNNAMKAAATSGSSGVSVNTDSDAAKATGTSSVAIGGGSQATGSNTTAIGEGASATGNGAVALGQGSVADEANTVSVGSQGNERRITNVAAGQGPTDAVNMAQFRQGLGDVARSAYSGIAAATALTMIPDVDPGKTIAVGIGTANFKGYQAGAIGASARITENLKVKVGAGLSAAGTTVGGGMSYQW